MPLPCTPLPPSDYPQFNKVMLDLEWDEQIDYMKRYS